MNPHHAFTKGVKKIPDENDIRDLLCKVLGCKNVKQTKPRFWFITLGPDEPIPKVSHMKLTKPLKPGFRRPITITPDEPVDVNDSGTFVKVEVLSGDSTVTVDPASSAKEIKVFLNGDGAIGDKAVRFTVDGHVGDGDQPVSLDVEFTVANPDATALTIAEGADEPIPT
jgi:hypothetical protein